MLKPWHGTGLPIVAVGLIIWLVAASPWIIVSVGAQESQLPYKGGEGGGDHQSPNYRERGTETHPFAVKIVPTPKPAADTQQEQEDRAEKLDADSWAKVFGISAVFIGIAQAIIFALQLVVFGVQAKRLKQTVDSYMHGERPYISPAAPKPSLMPTGAHSMYYATMGDPTKQGVPKPWIEYAFINVGRTPAIIEKVRAEIFLGKELPKTPTFTYSMVGATEIAVPTDKRYDPPICEFNRHLTVAEWQELKATPSAKGKEIFPPKDLAFFFFGYVQYRDVFGWVHTKGFGFHFRDQTPYLWGGKAYNYETSDEHPRKSGWWNPRHWRKAKS
jgi:hypothetical protein